MADDRAGSVGSVAVVGSGPGPHDLIAVRGRRLIREADVVFYHDRVSAALVGEARGEAELVRIATGDAQAANAAAFALEGRRVVWLVAGDGESIGWETVHAACEAAGVTSALVPGSAGVVKESPRPLSGRSVVVTRARHQAGTTCRLLEDLGATVVSMPTIAISPPEDVTALRRAVLNIGRYQRLILTSANAITPLLEALAHVGRDARSLAGVEICVIGPATGAELARVGLRPDIVAIDHRAEGVLDLLPASQIEGQRLLLLRAAVAREVLPQTLRQRGAHVDVVAAYRTTLPAPEQWRPGIAALHGGGVDVVTFTSASTVQNFAAIAGDELLVLTSGVTIAAIGPITAAACAEVGLRAAIVPEKYTVPAMVAALVDFFS